MQKKFSEAETILREVLDARRRLFKDDFIHQLDTMILLAQVVDAQGREAEADAIFREAVALAEPLRKDVLVRYILYKAYGLFLRQHHRLEEAETQLLRSYEGLKGRDHQTTKRILNVLIKLYRALDRPEKVAEFQRLKENYRGVGIDTKTDNDSP